MYTFGCSKYGQTGHGTTVDIHEPRIVDHFNKLGVRPVQVACGEHHTVVLCENGLVYGFGLGTRGQLGILPHLTLETVTLPEEAQSQMIYHLTPKVIKHVEKIPVTSAKFKQLNVRRNFFRVKLITCGHNCTFMVSESGQLYFCGENVFGLGARDSLSNEYKVVPCQFESLSKKSVNIVNVDLDLTPQSAGTKCSLDVLPILNPEPKQIVQVSCSGEHMACLDSDSRLFVCGMNVYGQLGLNDRRNRRKLVNVPLPLKLRTSGVKSIECGRKFTAILSSMYNTICFFFAMQRNGKSSYTKQTCQQMMESSMSWDG